MQLSVWFKWGVGGEGREKGRGRERDMNGEEKNTENTDSNPYYELYGTS
jgi:hypothetical protein